ncbi:hypothetical protein [Providencia heimbachae]|uniref:hypothetical protein n=1 Tax=Providencia heimbachae TaxID=333962 RepID=UPI00223FD85E|nr:hypothetical protein [Providencia heimbachae]
MDKSRRQFEEFILRSRSMLKENPFRRDNDSGLYYYPSIRNAYFFWQASRESLINNLPESINCPTAPELIWLQVDPEPEEINKPEFPVNLRNDDVTWCVDRIHPTDTLYIRADLIQK